MRDRDERPRALAERSALQLGDAVLGHHGPDVGAGGHDPGALLQGGDDAGDGALGGRRGSAMMARPSAARAAPRMKSIWPPTPE